MKWTPVFVIALALLAAQFAVAQEFPAIAEREAPANHEPGLLSRWHFVQTRLLGSTFFPDAGTLHATVWGPANFSGQAPFGLMLDGNSEARHRIVAGHSVVSAALPKKEITVEAWAKIEQPSEWGGLAGIIQDNGPFERGWMLGFRGTQFSFALAGQKPGKLTYLTSRRRFTPGYWYQVVGTYDGQEQRIYVDGELAGVSKLQQGDIFYPPHGEYVIGTFKDDDELHTTKGEIEQVSVWNRVLSAEEIATRFAKRSGDFPEIAAIRPEVTDWPTYNRDNQRTGISPDELQLPLSLAWEHQVRHPPAPAWPPPAKQDFWHQKYNLQPRVVYDRANHVVSVGNRVVFGSSADDAVRCLDATTGKLLWSYFTEGPVRLAPTVAESRVLFGSDDGFVHCVNAEDGNLFWKVRLGPEDRRIPGNRRIISVWPVRSSVLVEDGIAYFCAGMFPKQGVYQAAVNVETGEILAQGQIESSAQGYLERRAGRLFVPTGRDPAGAFVSQLERRGKDIGQEVREIPGEYPYAFIGAGKLRFGGGDGKVAAFELDTGNKVWEAAVEGKAWSLAIAQGRLLVSTDKGRIYSFAPGQHKPITHAAPYQLEKLIQVWDGVAIRDVLEESGVQKGFALVLANQHRDYLFGLAQRSEFEMIVLADNEESANDLRREIEAEGLANRMSVHQQSDSKSLPYTDYVFNLIVADNASANRYSKEELWRVLRPHGGAIVWNWAAKTIEKRGPLAEVGEWTHMYANPANTVCSDDKHVAGQMQLQWFGPPGPRQMLDRHLRTVAPLWKNGRLFIPGDNRVIAVDAYNGTPLWNMEIPDSRRVGAYRDCSYIVAGEDSVYVAAANVCIELDAATGEIRSTMPVPNLQGPIDVDPSAHQPAVADRPAEWGYLATVEELLIGSATAPNAARRESSLSAIHEGTFWDARPLVTSQGVFVLDRKTGKTKWTYKGQGAVINSTLMIADGQILFVESHNPETASNGTGRVKPGDLFHYGASIVALDLATGQERWRTPRNFNSIEHNIYGCAAQGKVVVVGSRNNGRNKEQSRVFYDVHVFDGKTGEPIWFRSQNQDTKIDGDHGEQDHHPVIVGDRLYCEPHAYKLHTGEPLADWGWNPAHRRGCGTISASATSFFFRESNPTQFDLTTNTYDKITTTTRPGCWINMIPAGGLLLIPEASSGCTCDYPIQTSLAFLPKSPKKPKAETIGE